MCFSIESRADVLMLVNVLVKAWMQLEITFLIAYLETKPN
jgi:hypothetical protein